MFQGYGGRAPVRIRARELKPPRVRSDWPAGLGRDLKLFVLSTRLVKKRDDGRRGETRLIRYPRVCAVRGNP